MTIHSDPDLFLCAFRGLDDDELGELTEVRPETVARNETVRSARRARKLLRDAAIVFLRREGFGTEAIARELGIRARTVRHVFGGTPDVRTPLDEFVSVVAALPPAELKRVLEEQHEALHFGPAKRRTRLYAA